MQPIPIHDFEAGARAPRFEVSPWSKTVSKYDSSLPHRHNYYEALIFLKGKGEHEIDFIKYPFRPCSIHFVSANQVHVVKRSPGSMGWSILFAKEFLPQGFPLHDFDFYKQGAYPVLKLNAKNFAAMNALLKALREEFASTGKMKREALQSLLHIFLVKAQRLYEAASGKIKQTATKHDFVVKLEKLIEEKFSSHWRAGDYARAMNVTVSQLNALCKQHFSKTTEALIQERILLEAKRLLVYSNNPVKEICYTLNFDDPAYFIRFFKKHTGITPLEYRKSVNH